MKVKSYQQKLMIGMIQKIKYIMENPGSQMASGTEDPR